MSELNESEVKILDAARKVFQKHGYAGARMQQIADEAGISKASLHYYFRSKENLFERIFNDTIAEFVGLLSTWDNENEIEKWEDKLRHFISQFFIFLQTKSLLFLIGELRRNPNLLPNQKAKRSSTTAKFIGYFENLCQAGKIKESNFPVIYIFLHSLCSYPIINETMFQKTIGLNQHDYKIFLETYPDYVSEVLIQTIKRGLK